jgi:hypothetical protein
MGPHFDDDGDDADRLGLESAVLDALDAADDEEVPDGVASLWTARRRRAADDVAGLLGGGAPPAS